jgi:N-hydroxyarylamine O-acetyltransferase
LSAAHGIVAGMTWDSDALDLDGYFDRIGFDGPRRASVPTLRALHRAHTTTVPFENLDIILGRPISLDIDAVQRKLVRSGRGGYCYEHVRLFAAALDRLGFGLTGLSGRVSLGAKDIRPATHALLRVTTPDDSRIWLCDVGFGAGPLEPLELAQGTEVDQQGWRLRLERGAGPLETELWTLWQHTGEGWLDRHSFAINPQHLIDWEVGNHYVSTSPRSPFTARPFVQRFTGRAHHVLDDLTVTTTRPDGGRESRAIAPAELPSVLRETFDLDLPDADVDALVARAGTSA